MMVYSEEIEELVSKRWAIRKGAREMGAFFEGIALSYGVVTALRHNKVFVPEKIDGLTEQQFVDKLESHIEKNMNDRSIDFKDDEEWMLQLIKAIPILSSSVATLSISASMARLTQIGICSHAILRPNCYQPTPQATQSADG